MSVPHSGQDVHTAPASFHTANDPESRATRDKIAAAAAMFSALLCSLLTLPQIQRELVPMDPFLECEAATKANTPKQTTISARNRCVVRIAGSRSLSTTKPPNIPTTAIRPSSALASHATTKSERWRCHSLITAAMIVIPSNDPIERWLYSSKTLCGRGMAVGDPVHNLSIVC